MLKRKDGVIIGLLLFFILLHVGGVVDPQLFWGINNFSFLPPVAFGVLASVTIIFTVYFLRKEKSIAFAKVPNKNWHFILVSAIVFFVFYNFPLAEEFYGDGYFIKENLEIEFEGWHPKLLTDLFDLEFTDTKVGLHTYYKFCNLIGYFLGGSVMKAGFFLVLVLGSVYSFIWLKLVHLYIKDPLWKLVFYVLGIGTPLAASFMGHYETYAFAYLGLITWFYLLGLYFKRRHLKYLIVSPFVFILVLQTHITYWLLFPSLLFMWAYHFKGQLTFVFNKLNSVLPTINGEKNTLGWSGLLVYVGVPILLVLSYAYFFIYKNYNGPRAFGEDEFESALFLPLYTDEIAPLDKYNLFSWDHIWDYMNLGLMWSCGLLFLLILSFTIYRKKINWNRPEIVMTGFTGFVFLFVFFILNPLLSLPIDWDLFAIPAFVFFPFSVFVFSQLDKTIDGSKAFVPTLGLILFGLSFWWVNADADLLGKKLGQSGMRNYKTYWIGSSTGIGAEISLIKTEKEKKTRIDEVLEEMKPHAVLNNDTEFGGMLTMKGRLYSGNDDEKALQCFEEARRYHPYLMSNLYELTIAYAKKGDYVKSLETCDYLVRGKYEPYKKSLLTAIQLSAIVRDFVKVEKYTSKLLELKPNHKIGLEIMRRLRAQEDLDNLANIF